MKKAIPVLIAIVLILVIAGVSFGAQIKEKYSYSNEKADLNEYFGVDSDDEAAILMGDERLEKMALVKDGTYYLDYDMVSDYFVYTRFYINEEDQYIRYVLPDRIVSCNIGESMYMDGTSETVLDHPAVFYKGDTLYFAVDFLRLFVTFDYEVYGNPNRIQIYTEHPERTVVKVEKASQVRYQGGVKSDILKEVKEGDKLVLLEQMENWSKVKSQDGFIGYIENKKLGEPVTEAGSFVSPSSVYGDVEFVGNTRNFKINMAWHQIGGVAGNDTLDGLISNTKNVNVVSPTWFHLTGNEGEIVSYATQNYVDKVHGMGMEVWALADDFTEEVDDLEIFKSAQNRETLINNLMNEVTAYGIDGINIDFEKVSESAGKHFVEFIRELSIPCRQLGIVLSVDNYPPSGGAIWYNRKEQSVYADYVIIMGYDEHWGSGGKAGSVASIDYVENGIKDTLNYVPAEKLINGIPFYTRVWKTIGTDTTSEAVGMDVAKEFIQNNQIDAQWDEATCQSYGEIQKGETLYQVWLEDYDSIKVKLDVMSTYDLAGVAEWKLGFENAEVWDLIADYVSK